MYRVEACLLSCQRYEVNDAHAYLLERLGDIAAAIKLYVRDIERCNSALIQGVLQGEVLLPNVTSASGRYAVHTHLLLYRIEHCHSMLPTPYMHVAWGFCFSLSMSIVRPDCNYLSFEALGQMQPAGVQVCVQDSVPMWLSMRSTHSLVNLLCAG